MTLAFYLLALLAHHQEGRSLDQCAGLVKVTVSNQWLFVLNPTAAAMAEDTNGPAIPEFSAAITFNGWPAGIVTPHGGIIAAGTAANEDSFIAALKAALDAAGVDYDEKGGA